MDELRCAIKLNLGQTLQNAAKAIPDLCAQLVYIDKDDKVQMIHETVQEFLVAEDNELQLTVVKKEGHTLIGSILVKYLCSGVLKLKHPNGQQTPPRPRGFVKASSAPPTVDPSLLEYASTFFSEHLYRSTSADDYLMDDVCNFLRAPSVLDWIEYLARTGDLATIGRTAANLREYLGGRTKYVPPTDRSIQLVDAWVTDLIRVAAKFRAQLLACPSSIHCLIPPLCPPDSMISRTFAKETRPSSVPSILMAKGLPSGSWDDCLIRMDFQKGQTTVVRHGDRYFAVGLSTGQISLYDPNSMQCLRQMKHPERVKILEFGPDDSLLASCGAKHLVIWDPKSSTLVHSFPLRSPPLAITFLGTAEILAAFQSSDLTKWDLQSGNGDSISWKDVGCGGEQDSGCSLEGIVPTQAPSRAAFLTIDEEVLLSVGYRSHPILIWNALELRLIGLCTPDFGTNGVNDMVFNPKPDIPVLVVSFQDGSLCVFDYTTLDLQLRRPQVYAQCLSCSPDGRTLVVGTTQGAIEVFEFERDHYDMTTLVLIYRTNHPLDDTIRSVASSFDGLRFIDVRGRQGRVWAPAALVRKSLSELESSIGSSEVEASLLSPPKSNGMLDLLENPEITSSVISCSNGIIVVVGKSNGDVTAFSAVDGNEIGVLYKHGRGSSIVTIAVSQSSDMVVSADDSARVLVARFDQPLTGNILLQQQKPNIVLDRRFNGAVASITFNRAADKLLVNGRYSDQLWDLVTGQAYLKGGQPVPTVSGLNAKAISPPAQSVSPGPFFSTPELAFPNLRSAVQHPSNLEWFMTIAGDIVRIYSWLDFSELTSDDGIQLNRPSASQLSPHERIGSDMSTSGTVRSSAAATYHVGAGFVLEMFRSSTFSTPQLNLWPASSLDPTSSGTIIQPAIEPNLETVRPNVLSILGVVGMSTVLFLDTGLWVCSTDLQSIVSSVPSPGPVTFRASGFESRSNMSAPSTAQSSRRTSAWSSSTTNLVGSAPTVQAHAKRHFFALSEWRSSAGDLRCALVTPATVQPLGRVGVGSGGGGRDVGVVFAHGHRLVTIKGGLEFAESVAVPASSSTKATGRDIWNVVSGSMHRRSSNW